MLVPIFVLADEICKLNPAKLEKITTSHQQGIALVLGSYELSINNPTKIILETPEIFYFDNDKKIAFQQVLSEANQLLYNDVFSLSDNKLKQTKQITLIRNMLNIDCDTQLTQYKLSSAYFFIWES